MSFFGSLLGKDQSKAIGAASQQAAGQVNEGYDSAKGNIRSGMTEAQGYYQPFAQSGQQANKFYSNALGMNGAQGGQEAQTAYSAGMNPYMTQQQDRTTNALMRSYNARGMGAGGTAAMAAARANNEMQYGAYNDWMGRIQGQSNQGAQIAGQQAGVAQSGYGQLAQNDVGRGQTLAGNTINTVNAQNAATQGGINNLLSIGGALLGAGTRMATGGAFGGFGGGGGGGGLSPGMVQAINANGWQNRL